MLKRQEIEGKFLGDRLSLIHETILNHHNETDARSALLYVSLSQQQFSTILATGESQTVEFKQQLPSKWAIAKALSAFANTAGGILCIGVTDRGQVCGIDSPDRTLEQIDTVSQFHLDPPLTVKAYSLNVYGLAIVIVEIPNSIDKPHRIVQLDQNQDLIYIRQHASSIQTKPNTVRRSSSLTPVPTTASQLSKLEQAAIQYLSQNPSISIKQLSSLCNISKRRSRKVLNALNNLGIVGPINTNQDIRYVLLTAELEKRSDAPQ